MHVMISCVEELGNSPAKPSIQVVAAEFAPTNGDHFHGEDRCPNSRCGCCRVRPHQRRPLPRRRSLPQFKVWSLPSSPPPTANLTPANLPPKQLRFGRSLPSSHPPTVTLATATGVGELVTVNRRFCCGFVSNKMPRSKIVDLGEASGSTNPRVPVRDRVSKGTALNPKFEERLRDFQKKECHLERGIDVSELGDYYKWNAVMVRGKPVRIQVIDINRYHKTTLENPIPTGVEHQNLFVRQNVR
ncbi:hypothetical protein LWI28_001997 [Acer negundo]|uniref:Uncharacterized protein n=1 Tax=Acer negundo TaxID=4023 RepID=A0AAD5ICJ1_ACENE|nr:hypothetical protein LWI28_001997 [Acer negundo]